MQIAQEPVLMQHQWREFNGDIYVASEFLNLKERFGVRAVCETGTCLGVTTLWFTKNFDEVHTIEINPEYRNFALKRLEGKGSATLFSHLGSSSEILKDIVKKIDSNTIFFLDAHWGKHCPLQDELRVITESKLKPVIVIHDFLVPNHPEFGYDDFNGQPFTYEWLKPLFDNIYGEGNYEHYYNSAIYEQSAKRGVIYVTPKLTPVNNLI